MIAARIDAVVFLLVFACLLVVAWHDTCLLTVGL